MNQAERYQSTDMRLNRGVFEAAIPPEFTDSPFPLQYYFEVRWKTGAALFPGFDRQFTNQPYFVVRQIRR